MYDTGTCALFGVRTMIEGPLVRAVRKKNARSRSWRHGDVQHDSSERKQQNAGMEEGVFRLMVVRIQSSVHLEHKMFGILRPPSLFSYVHRVCLQENTSQRSYLENPIGRRQGHDASSHLETLLCVRKGR